jgi:hypothetical protein
MSDQPTKDDYSVRLEIPAAPNEPWFVSVVDVNGQMELWFGEGPTIEAALADLARGMAAELEARVRVLPDGYVDLVNRRPTATANPGDG